MRYLVTLFAALILFAAPASALDLGGDLERGLGKMVAEELETTYGVVNDPILSDWVDRIGQRLASVAGRPNVRYSFKILDSDDVNAVAAPGGFVYINRGTLRFVKSEDELASVLGHEVGHVAGRHAMKQLNAQLLGSLVLLGFQAARAETLRTAGSIAGGLAMLKFSRDEENDADRRGLKNAVASGYDGGAMLDFFRRLESIERDKPSRFETYFLTHPPTGERIQRVAHEPGTADSAANAIALGDGFVARGLYRQAADSYRHALRLAPRDAVATQRLAAADAHKPRLVAAKPLPAATRALRLQQLAAFGDELEETRSGITDDRKRLDDAHREMDSELESAAQSLSDAGQIVSRRDVVQYRQLVRMARSFDQAARVGSNLRAVRDMADDAIGDLARLRQALQQAVEQGDAAAADQVESLLMVHHAMLKQIRMGVHQASGRAGDAREGARTLRQSAESLLNSYRVPFGYTSGQFDILDLQVSTAQDSLHGAVDSSRAALLPIARARVETLVGRMNYLTRVVSPDDGALPGIVAHYLGVTPEAVRARRMRLELGDAALSLAADRAAQSRKGRPAAPEADSSAGSDRAAKSGLKWENAAVLFNLMVNDVERETGI